MRIIEDDLQGEEIQALLQHHVSDALTNSPPDEVFALDLSGLLVPEITFWSVWDDSGDVLLGCGALKTLSPEHGEVKSMRTTDAAMRKGVGSVVLSHIIETARARGMTRLSLETGTNEAYEPARKFYAKFGFEKCGNFDQYKWGGFSYLMSKAL